MSTVNYRLEDSIITKPERIEEVRRLRALDPNSSLPSDEEIWLDEVGQYRVALQARTLNYINDHHNDLIDKMCAMPDVAVCPLVALRPFMSENLWKQWRALGMPLGQDIFQPDIDTAAELDETSNDERFRDWMRLT